MPRDSDNPRSGGRQRLTRPFATDGGPRLTNRGGRGGSDRVNRSSTCRPPDRSSARACRPPSKRHERGMILRCVMTPVVKARTSQALSRTTNASPASRRGGQRQRCNGPTCSSAGPRATSPARTPTSPRRSGQPRRDGDSRRDRRIDLASPCAFRARDQRVARRRQASHPAS
jgi:hypothetical protein